MDYLNEEDIIRSATKIYKVGIDLKEYDMYYVCFQMRNGKQKIVKTFCEKGAFPEVGSEEYKRKQGFYVANIVDAFFVKRLLGSNGLMAKEGRNDYIYLGGEAFEKGGLANRNMIQANGKTGQANFDMNLQKLKSQVEAQVGQENRASESEHNRQPSKTGKTYVVGDIHGMYGSYMEVINKMTPNDHLIIIGDVIDRGHGGIKIIQDIIRRQKDRKNNPEITFLLGNHEMQFIKTIEIMSRRNLNENDLNLMINTWDKYDEGCEREKHKVVDAKADAEYDRLYQQYMDLFNRKGLTPEEVASLSIWIRNNHGNTTIFDFLDNQVVKGRDERTEIYQFLTDSYVILPSTIENRDYLFVHAAPPKDISVIQSMAKTKNGYKYSELPYKQEAFMVEARESGEEEEEGKKGKKDEIKEAYEMAKRAGFTTICGHSPETGYITEKPEEGFIRIDAGCGHGDGKGRDSSLIKLALYRVDDGSVEYLNENEKEGVNRAQER